MAGRVLREDPNHRWVEFGLDEVPQGCRQEFATQAAALMVGVQVKLIDLTKASKPAIELWSHDRVAYWMAMVRCDQDLPGSVSNSSLKHCVAGGNGDPLELSGGNDVSIGVVPRGDAYLGQCWKIGLGRQANRLSRPRQHRARVAVTGLDAWENLAQETQVQCVFWDTKKPHR